MRHNRPGADFRGPIKTISATDMNPYQWLLASATLLPLASHAISAVEVQHLRIIELPMYAVALPAESRSALREWIDAQRSNKDICRFEIAVVMGWASADEGNFSAQRRLAKMRAEYVAHQLLGISLPSSNTFVSEGDLEVPHVLEASPPSQGVTIYLRGLPGSGDCTAFPPNTVDSAGNMRARTAAFAKQPRGNRTAKDSAK